jgi:hypothetical protein
MDKRHIPVTVTFTGDLTGNEAENIRIWRGNTHHLTSTTLKGNIIECVIQAGIGDNAHQATLRGTVRGTHAFKCGTMKCVTETLKSREQAGLPLCWVDGNKALYTFNGNIPTGLLTYTAMTLKNLT